MGINSRIALVRTLKKRDWSYAKEDNGVWLRNGDYFLHADEEEWRLFYKTGEELITVKEKVYGRRQSQEVIRAMESDQKVRQRCRGTLLNSKAGQ